MATVTTTDTRDGTQKTTQYRTWQEALEAARTEYEARKPKRFTKNTEYDKVSGDETSLKLEWKHRDYVLTVEARDEQETEQPGIEALSDEELLVAWDEATEAAEATEWDETTTREVERIESEVIRRGLSN